MTLVDLTLPMPGPGQPGPVARRETVTVRRAMTAMAEAGVDISGHQPKPVDSVTAVPSDYGVTACDPAAERCPLFSGKTRLVHHGLGDPPEPTG